MPDITREELLDHTIRELWADGSVSGRRLRGLLDFADDHGAHRAENKYPATLAIIRARYKSNLTKIRSA